MRKAMSKPAKAKETCAHENRETTIGGGMRCKDCGAVVRGKAAPSPAEPIHVAGTRPDLLCCTPSPAERWSRLPLERLMEPEEFERLAHLAVTVSGRCPSCTTLDGKIVREARLARGMVREAAGLNIPELAYAEIDAPRVALKKAEEERDAQTRRADVTLAKMCDARDAVVARATAAEAKLKKAEEKNKQLRHLLQLATGRTP